MLDYIIKQNEQKIIYKQPENVIFTVDAQKAFYQEISSSISERLKELITILSRDILNDLQTCAEHQSFNEFEEYYGLISRSLSTDDTICKPLGNICNALKTQSLEVLENIENLGRLKEIEYKIANLLPYVSDMHDPNLHLLEFNNMVHDLRNHVGEVWNSYIQRAYEAEMACMDLESLLESNEKFKTDAENLAKKLYFSQHQITDHDIHSLLKQHKELVSNFDKLKHFFHSNNPLKMPVLRDIQSYGNLVLDKIIHQSIVDSMDKNQDVSNSFFKLYMEHTNDMYQQSYGEHNETITLLNTEYSKCGYDAQHQSKNLTAIGTTLQVDLD